MAQASLPKLHDSFVYRCRIFSASPSEYFFNVSINSLNLGFLLRQLCDLIIQDILTVIFERKMGVC